MLAVEHRGYKIDNSVEFTLSGSYCQSLGYKNQSFTAQDHVYIVRIRKIKGMFGLMLIVGIMTFVPGLLDNIN